MSRNNLPPSLWGKNAWRFLYSVALGYPAEPSDAEQTAAHNFISSLSHLLPCEQCRTNFTRKMNGPMGKQMDTALQNSDSFVKYLHELEIDVASTIPGKSITTEDVKQRVLTQNQAATTNTTPSSLLPWILLPFLVALAVIITWLVTKTVHMAGHKNRVVSKN